MTVRLPLFTSDTHFFHGKMAERRGFAGVQDMNDVVQERWNRKVSPGDTVYHLGDLSFAGVGRTVQVLRELNGHLKIVPGNHDDPKALRQIAEHPLMQRRPNGSFEVLPPIKDLKVSLPQPNGTTEVVRVVLCHFPMLSWNKAHFGALHLHGHSHGTCRYPDPKQRILDVGIDTRLTKLDPWSFTEVLEAMSSRGYTPVDQHVEAVSA